MVAWFSGFPFAILHRSPPGFQSDLYTAYTRTGASVSFRYVSAYILHLTGLCVWAAHTVDCISPIPPLYHPVLSVEPGMLVGYWYDTGMISLVMPDGIFHWYLAQTLSHTLPSSQLMSHAGRLMLMQPVCELSCKDWSCKGNRVSFSRLKVYVAPIAACHRTMDGVFLRVHKLTQHCTEHCTVVSYSTCNPK